jgi:hypothetical protein
MPGVYHNYRMRAQEDGVEDYYAALTSRQEVAVCIESYTEPHYYITRTQGSWWLTTDHKEPKNVSEIGWTGETIRGELRKADDVVPMKLVEAPFGHLVVHHPDTSSRPLRSL